MNPNPLVLDLSTFEIETIDFLSDDPIESLSGWDVGHGITEIGASCDCHYTCTGSCMLPERS
jgi:hypothetical protein